MVEAGVTIFRINLSWFNEAEQRQWATKIAEIGRIARRSKNQLVLGIMLDTKGPEFRVHRVLRSAPIVHDDDKGFEYKPRTKINLTFDPSGRTDEKTIAVEAPEDTVITKLSESRRVVFCDGEYEATIESLSPDGNSMVIESTQSFCVWNKAKVNFPGTSVTAESLSEVDTTMLKFFVERVSKKLDKRVRFMFAQSFIKSAQDLNDLRAFLRNSLRIRNPIIIAKLETYESTVLTNLAPIIAASSAVMIARGDLANEMSRQRVPRIQRDIIKVAKELNKPVLLATQVYASMANKNNMKCTRPEAEDVRSALELGVDGFVLTGETVKRWEHPEDVVVALANQIAEDEEDLVEAGHYEKLREPVRKVFHDEMRERMLDPTLSIQDQQWLGTTDFAIAAVFRANTYRAIGLFPFTSGGQTIREMSRFYPETEIYAITRSPEAALACLLCRCAHPILIEIDEKDLKKFYIDKFKELVRDVVNELKLRQRKPKSRYAICTMAHPPLQAGGTDLLLRVRIDDLPL